MLRCNLRSDVAVLIIPHATDCHVLSCGTIMQKVKKKSLLLSARNKNCQRSSGLMNMLFETLSIAKIFLGIWAKYDTGFSRLRDPRDIGKKFPNIA